MLTIATNNEMIVREEDSIKAEFLYDKQVLSPNLADLLKDKLTVGKDIEPMA